MAADIAALARRHAPPADLRLRGRRRSAPASTPAAGATGLLLVTGGSQTRIGSHRMYERLAKALAEQRLSLPALRPARGRRQRRRGSRLSRQRPRSRRGRRRLRARMPGPARVYRLRPVRRRHRASPCSATQAGLDGLILVNPWLVEAEAGEPRAGGDPARIIGSGCSAWRAGRESFPAQWITGRSSRAFARSAAARAGVASGRETAAALARHGLPRPADPRRRRRHRDRGRGGDRSRRLSGGWPSDPRDGSTAIRTPSPAPATRRRLSDGRRWRALGPRLRAQAVLTGSAAGAASKSASARNFSASSAAMQPVPAAVTAWR